MVGNRRLARGYCFAHERGALLSARHPEGRLNRQKNDEKLKRINRDERSPQVRSAGVAYRATNHFAHDTTKLIRWTVLRHTEQSA
jgi:hypothetical protein